MKVFVFVEKVFYCSQGVQSLQRCAIDVFSKVGAAIAYRCDVRNTYINGFEGMVEDFAENAVILNSPKLRVVLQILEKEVL